MGFFKDFHSEIKMLMIVCIIATVIIAGAILILKSLSSPIPVQQESQQVSVEAQPTEEPTEIDASDWQTYRNEEFGFEVKYPKNWEYTLGGNKGDLICFTKSIGDCTEAILQIRKDVSFNEIVDQQEKIYKSTALSKEQINVDGITGKVFVFRTSAGERYVAIFESGGHVFDFRLVNGEQELFDQILSTFRFIESVEIADWRTYRNEEFGFEVQYPLEYEQNVQCKPHVITDTKGDSLVFIGPIIISWRDPVGLTLEEYVDKIVEDTKPNPEQGLFVSRVTSHEDILFAGENAEKLSFEIVAASAYSPINIYVQREAQIMKVSYDDGIINQCPFDSYKLPSEVADQILSTFRFIE